MTVGQYTAFLNAVAATDTYSLYNPSMASDAQHRRHLAELLAELHVQRDRFAESSGYVRELGRCGAVRQLAAQRTADRRRRRNARPKTARTRSTARLSNAALLAVTRNANAKWFIPTENEWYKAAYYQPAAAGRRFGRLLGLSDENQQRAELRPAAGRDRARSHARGQLLLTTTE